MRLHVEHDAATVATLAGADNPSCDGLILELGTNTVLAASMATNPLDPDWIADVDIPANRLVLWSGTLSSDGLFAPECSNWLGKGRQALDAFCKQVLPTLQLNDMRLCLRPHARHILSDVPSCLWFHEQWCMVHPEHFELAMAPFDLLTPMLMPAIDEHLHRVLSTLQGKTALAFIHDVVVDQQQDSVLAAGLGTGELDPGCVVPILKEHLQEHFPAVLQHGDIQQQQQWLKMT